MQTAKAASTVARIAERIIALWHSKVFTFWSDHFEKRLINESIESKVLMRLCCNGVVLLRLTRRGRAGRPKNSAKSRKSPLPLIALRKVDVIVVVTLAAPALAAIESGMFQVGLIVMDFICALMIGVGVVILPTTILVIQTCLHGSWWGDHTPFGPQGSDGRELLPLAIAHHRA